MKKYLVPLLALVLLVSCRTHKNTADTPSATAVTTTPDAKPTRTAPKLNGVAARLNFTALQQGVKKASAGGYLRMKRDEIIQVRLVALIVEVGRLELTPEYLLVQDRMNKQYVRVSWDDVPQLKQAGVSFDTMQQLFWGEYPNAKKGLTLTLDSKTSIRLAYADWDKLAGQDFPQQMTLTIQSGQNNYGGIFRYANLQADDHIEVQPTAISSSYKQVELDKILKQLTK